MSTGMRYYKNYIFDFDGTLAHTAPDILASIRKSCEKYGVNIDQDSLDDNLIGPPLDVIIKKIRPDIEDDVLNQVIRTFRSIYDSSTFPLTELYPGIKEVLSELHRNGVCLFIATNKRKIPLTNLLKKLDIFDLMDGFRTVDYTGGRLSKTEMVKMIISEHKLDKEDSIMIGDAMGDINAGIAAGISTAAALWGYSNSDEKQELCSKADYSIKTPHDILDFRLR